LDLNYAPIDRRNFYFPIALLLALLIHIGYVKCIDPWEKIQRELSSTFNDEEVKKALGIEAHPKRSSPKATTADVVRGELGQDKVDRVGGQLERARLVVG